MVSDDDSLMRSQMRNSYQSLVDTGIMAQDDWPKTARGNKKKVNGKFELTMTPPKFSADPNHRVKVRGKHFFGLSKLPKSQSDETKAFI